MISSSLLLSPFTPMVRPLADHLQSSRFKKPAGLKTNRNTTILPIEEVFWSLWSAAAAGAQDGAGLTWHDPIVDGRKTVLCPLSSQYEALTGFLI